MPPPLRAGARHRGHHPPARDLAASVDGATGIRRPLERLIARHWEIALYGAVVGVALALRLWDLDARGFQHDESRHVYYTGVSAPPGAVILVSTFNQPAIEPYLSGYREGIVYRHAWWFPESYRGLHAANFLRDLLRGGYLDTWRDYFVHRRVTGAETAPDVIAYFPRQDAAPPDCAPPSPAPAPLDADATAFVAWARANRPSALPADGATILHLPSADIFAQDFERIAVALVSSSAREPTCRAAREASRAAWAAYLRRTAVNSPGARLEPIQEGRGGDIDIATSIVLAACDWRESLPAPP